MSNTHPKDNTPSSTPDSNLIVELLALDLDTCTRCTGSLANIEKALRATSELLAYTGRNIQVQKTIVRTAAQAIQARFVSSPTIRVNGMDILPEIQETACEECSERCGCGEDTTCRVWPYQGEVYEEAPVGYIIEALMQAAFSQPAEMNNAAYEGLPENLERFFQGVSSKTAASCCEPAVQETCCEPADKAACCGAEASASCGCQ